jgi:hypothetical protein
MVGGKGKKLTLRAEIAHRLERAKRARIVLKGDGGLLEL